MQAEGEFAWHFDTNEFTVSILVQAPERGGLFEFAPNIRTPEDGCYRDVAEVIAGDSEHAVAGPEAGRPAAVQGGIQYTEFLSGG